MANIILAHGILGIGALPFGIDSPYFNGIAAQYREQGHAVLVPTVDLLGSLERRAAQLRQAIDEKWPDKTGLIVMAHSMGGLDIRRAVARSPKLASRVATIAAIATPHLGSPVADAVLNPRHPLRPHIPGWLLRAFGPRAGALADLQTRTALHDPDVEGIRYYEVGCDASQLSSASPLFALTQAIGKLSSNGNDGVVTLSSAQTPDRALLQTWPVDHCGAIGWPSGLLFLQTFAATLTPPGEHIKRYKELLELLLGTD